MHESSVRTTSGVRAHRLTIWVLTIVTVLGHTMAATAQVDSLYYREARREGTIFVFNTAEKYELWQTTGELPQGITMASYGPDGETVVAENQTALQLFDFKHHQGVAGEPKPVPPPAAAAPELPQVKIGALWYLSYQNGEVSGSDLDKLTIKRGYVNIEAKVLPFMSARITPDVHQDDSGDLKMRLKYAYAKFHASDLGFLTKPELEVGIVHMPWLDFEEHINHYRMQDTMFMERNGMYNSADAGVTAMALLGGTVSEEYQKNVSKYYPGRWGSLAVGVYNGGGYHAGEANTNKVLEGRLTVRPLPDRLTGLQLSYFGVRGRGNTAAEPDWDVDALMLSFECRRLVFTGTWMDATGNQKGNATAPDGRALDRDGWSAFAEVKLDPRWSVIGRFDVFDPDKGTEDDGNTRTIAGVAYHLGKGNTILLDYDQVDFDAPSRDKDRRVQLTLQVKY